MANLYTKTGDKGQTSLVGGSRVSKSSLRVECYGTIDEANSMLGLAYAQTDREYIRTTVHRIQGRLFALGAELASDEQGAAGLTGKISEEDVAFLEGVVDKCTETTGKQTHFVIPGVDPASAALHVARTIVRRAERHVVARAEREPVREVLARYINRLSDAVYALARLQEAGRQIPEEVALAGVGDTVSGRIVSPKLTSVHFYYKTSGKEAARLLLELLDGNEARKQIKMGYRVEERGTTRQRYYKTEEQK